VNKTFNSSLKDTEYGEGYLKRSSNYAFNSSLKDTYGSTTVFGFIAIFQFLIKGYRRIGLLPRVQPFRAFNSSLKDTELVRSGGMKLEANFQFLIKGYVRKASGRGKRDTHLSIPH